MIGQFELEWINIIFPDFVIDDANAGIKMPCRLALIAAGLFEGFDNEFPRSKFSTAAASESGLFPFTLFAI